MALNLFVYNSVSITLFNLFNDQGRRWDKTDNECYSTCYIYVNKWKGSNKKCTEILWTKQLKLINYIPYFTLP